MWAGDRKRHRPCCARCADYGIARKRRSARSSNRLPFCEVHGAECRDGDLSELYFDATLFLQRPLNAHVPELNAAAASLLRTAVEELNDIGWEVDDDERIVRAYPELGKEVDESFFGTYVGTSDFLRDARFHIHRLMRLSVEARQDWLVEPLELKREEVVAQLAYLIRIRAQEAADA